MLTEDQVVDAVRAHLESSGYKILSSLRSTERGVDLVARSHSDPPFELHVEAKGAGSSRLGSARFGLEFNSGQVFDHIAKAVLKALQAANAPGAQIERRGGIALPDNRLHRRHIEPVAHALRRAGIAVFWVDDQGIVSVDSDWPL